MTTPNVAKIIVADFEPGSWHPKTGHATAPVCELCSTQDMPKMHMQSHASPSYSVLSHRWQAML